MTPQQPEKYTKDKVSYPCYIQPYLNGVRTLYQDGAFQSECDWGPVIKKIAEQLRDIFPKKVVLDGVIHYGDFHVFDVVNLKSPFRYRFDSVSQILRDSERYHRALVVPTRRVSDEKSANDQLDKWMNEGYTGVIYRVGGCKYTKATPGNPTNINPQLLRREVL